MKTMSHRSWVLVVALALGACVVQRDQEQRTAQDPEPRSAAADAAASAQAEKKARRALEQQRAHERVRAPAGAPVLISAPAPAAELASCCWGPPTITERYQSFDDNPVKLAAEQPVSTFSIDVDTGAYANVRRFLSSGRLPPQDAVRVEELINYFDYDYAPPATREVPFSVTTDLARAPWNSDAVLLRIGIKGFEVPARERPAANLVFLVDVSGSMNSPDKLPLLKNAFRLLTEQLTERDRVALVAYAGASGVVLEPTPGSEKHKILEAIGRLEAGGTTNGAAGIEQAYQLARAAFIDGGINRVVLATDGDFNVGLVDFDALVGMVERERKSGVALTTLGFGTGNYNDRLLERLADAGNGNYAYIDNLTEARKVLVQELSSTLLTIAHDVKIQVEFNPAEVLEYRLIGYENRMLARADFNNDGVDAGEIGAGHRVTALYEIVPVGAKGRVDPLRYGTRQAASAPRGELAYLRVRYKLPGEDASKVIEHPIRSAAVPEAAQASADFCFAMGVAAFGQLLRGGKYMERFGYRDAQQLVEAGLANDRHGYRRELVALIELAASLAGERVSDSKPSTNTLQERGNRHDARP
jgi:Ca-activated chloride channel family protein